jgi:glutathione S-transferase
MIELWGRKNAYNVQKVLWTLDELELDYSHHDIGSITGELETAEYLAINPHARIPTLVDSNHIVWESNSIVRYLAAEYGGGQIYAEQPLQRSLAERWMDWELSKLQPDFIDLFWGYYRKAENQRDNPAIQGSLTRCFEHFRLLDAHLENRKYLAGDDFSIADITCATSLYRYFTMGIEVEKPVQVMAWYQRLVARKAFQQNIMLPYDELKARTDF